MNNSQKLRRLFDISGVSQQEAAALIAKYNREKFERLCKEAGITARQAEELVETFAHSECSVRTVRSWLADPTRPSSRACKDWAVESLAAQLKIENRLP